jgi:hypothetical protein
MKEAAVYFIVGVRADPWFAIKQLQIPTKSPADSEMMSPGDTR